MHVLLRPYVHLHAHEHRLLRSLHRGEDERVHDHRNLRVRFNVHHSSASKCDASEGDDTYAVVNHCRSALV